MRTAQEAGDLEYGVAAFIDTETTGFSCNTDEVVEIGICLIRFRRDSGQIEEIIDEYSGLRDPGRPIPLGATRVHGLTDADVKGKRIDTRKLLDILKRAEFVVAHNASFDKRFVERTFPDLPDKPWFCSLHDVRWRKRGFRCASLQYLIEAHNLQREQAHRALGDVKAMVRLLATVDDSGRPYFAEILEKAWNMGRSDRR